MSNYKKISKTNKQRYGLARKGHGNAAYETIKSVHQNIISYLWFYRFSTVRFRTKHDTARQMRKASDIYRIFPRKLRAAGFSKRNSYQYIFFLLYKWVSQKV